MAQVPSQNRSDDAGESSPSRKVRRYLYLSLALGVIIAAGLYWLSASRSTRPEASDAWRLGRPDVRAQLAWLEAAAREGQDRAQVSRFEFLVRDAFDRLLETPEGAALAAEAEPLLQELQASVSRGEEIAGIVAHLDQLLEPENVGD